MQWTPVNFCLPYSVVDPKYERVFQILSILAWQFFFLRFNFKQPRIITSCKNYRFTNFTSAKFEKGSFFINDDELRTELA